MLRCSTGVAWSAARSTWCRGRLNPRLLLVPQRPNYRLPCSIAGASRPQRRWRGEAVGGGPAEPDAGGRSAPNLCWGTLYSGLLLPVQRGSWPASFFRREAASGASRPVARQCALQRSPAVLCAACSAIRGPTTIHIRFTLGFTAQSASFSVTVQRGKLLPLVSSPPWACWRQLSWDCRAAHLSAVLGVDGVRLRVRCRM